MQQSIQTLRRNVQWTAFLSTPGAFVTDYDKTGQRFRRALTEEEAAAFRPQYEESAAQLSERDPHGYAAWLAAFETWRAGDLGEDMPRPENFAGGEEQ